MSCNWFRSPTRFAAFILAGGVAGALSCSHTRIRVATTSYDDFTVPYSRDRVFDASLAVAQKLNLSVAVLEKASGLQRFEIALLSPAQLDQYCEFPKVDGKTGQPESTFVEWNDEAKGTVHGSVSLNVLLTEHSPNETAINIRGNWTVVGGGEAYQVNSTRMLETEFHAKLANELNAGIPPGPQASTSATDRLDQLQKLFDRGLIERHDYDRKRQEILHGL